MSTKYASSLATGWVSGAATHAGTTGDPYQIDEAFAATSGGLGAGDTLRIKPDGTYNISSALAPPAGNSTSPTIIMADSGLPIINTTANSATFTPRSANRFIGLKLTTTSATKTTTYGFSDSLSSMLGVFIQDCIVDGLQTGLRGVTNDCNVTWQGGEIKNCLSNAVVMTSGGTSNFEMRGADVHNNSVGFDLGGSKWSLHNIHHCTITNNGTYQIRVSASSETRVTLNGNTIDGGSGDGIKLNGTFGASSVVNIFNNLISNNIGSGAYGINGVTGVDTFKGFCDYNVFWNNAAARNIISAGAHDVTLTQDPFTNRIGRDYSLNSTAGGGAAARAVGYPGTIASASSYFDIGACQHADATGGGGSRLQSSMIVGGK